MVQTQKTTTQNGVTIKKGDKSPGTLWASCSSPGHNHSNQKSLKSTQKKYKKWSKPTNNYKKTVQTQKKVTRVQELFGQVALAQGITTATKNLSSQPSKNTTKNYPNPHKKKTCSKSTKNTKMVQSHKILQKMVQTHKQIQKMVQPQKTTTKIGPAPRGFRIRAWAARGDELRAGALEGQGRLLVQRLHGRNLIREGGSGRWDVEDIVGYL